MQHSCADCGRYKAQVERVIEGDPVIRRVFNGELSTLGRSPDTFYVNPLVQRFRQAKDSDK